MADQTSSSRKPGLLDSTVCTRKQGSSFSILAPKYQPCWLNTSLPNHIQFPLINNFKCQCLGHQMGELKQCLLLLLIARPGEDVHSNLQGAVDVRLQAQAVRHTLINMSTCGQTRARVHTQHRPRTAASAAPDSVDSVFEGLRLGSGTWETLGLFPLGKWRGLPLFPLCYGCLHAGR